MECVNCLANFHTLKYKQEQVDVLYDALLKLLGNSTERNQALDAIHFLEQEGE